MFRLTLFAALALMPTGLSAQLIGTVIDGFSGRTLEGVALEATLHGRKGAASTDSYGRFVLDLRGTRYANVRSGVLVARLPGYQPHSLDIVLNPGLQRLPPIRLEATAISDLMTMMPCGMEPPPPPLVELRCQGINAYWDGDYAKAVELLEPVVNAGGDEALLALPSLLASQFKAESSGWERSLDLATQVHEVLRKPELCDTVGTEAQAIVCPGGNLGHYAVDEIRVEYGLSIDYVRILAGLPPGGEV